jgi:hypothetical protein
VSVLPQLPLSALLMQGGNPADGWIGSWAPGIGDPTVVGWITVVAYLVAAGLCLRVYRRLPAPAAAFGALVGAVVALVPVFWAITGRARRLATLPAHARLRGLWLSLAILLLLLGINKQLDLQTALTEVGRILAHREGWYERRRVVQLALIVCVLLAGACGLRAIVLLTRGSLRSMRAVLAGTLALVCFVVIRAASFHHVDILLGLRLGGLKANWILELGGIAFVGFGAYREGARLAPSKRVRAVGSS